MKRILIALSFLAFSWIGFVYSQEFSPKKVLIVTEGISDLNNPSYAVGRQILTLFGHFSAQASLIAVHDYTPEMMEKFDIIFYTGFNPKNTVPRIFLNDVFKTTKQVIWQSTGFIEFCHEFPVEKHFGFSVARFDSTTEYSIVNSGSKIFTRSEMTTGIIHIADRQKTKVLATIRAKKNNSELPYIVQSGNLTYFADSPLSYTDVNDRYLLFADMLHDILGEHHEEKHTAIVRIEDVDAFENPNELRDIADLLSSKGIPFLVGVVPFYVDPNTGTRSSLSEQPELVDALKYMVRNGGTIVMHGTTHQYKGTTTVDFEYWDENTNKPIKEQTEADIERKFDMGIQEFMRNGLYPLIWETPHYTASRLAYKVAARHFSTACEQRLANEDADFSQYFPYIINKDLYGQTIYPENLGYVPQDANPEVGENAARVILGGAKTLLNVRDGVAGFFFHPFLKLHLVEEIVDGMQKMGYSFLDLKDYDHWVRTSDRVILSGTQQYSLKMNDQYLAESYYDHSGEIIRKVFSDTRLKGNITKTIELENGEYYKAEPVEFREKPVSTMESVVSTAEHLYENVFPSDENWHEAKVAILWNHHARGAAFQDQASFASVFHSIHVSVDTIFVRQPIDLSKYNLLIVPFAFVDSLGKEDYTTITQFVANGGNIITDDKNELAKELGIQYTNTRMKVNSVRDKYFPEERINWRYSELITKFEIDQLDEVFCYDEITEAPMIIGKKFGKGRVIYIGSRFDPYSQEGYSLYPFLIDYVKKYFQIRPIVRRENLEVYFDPGFRHNYSIEQLIAQWVRNGIRIVHVSAWHEYPKYTYDYERLIRLAHANGILVFAWIEPPQVSQKFWLEHPEWREKNFKGEDIRPSWRYPVALTDERCVDEMIKKYTSFLNALDWDGANIAELYFEAGRGFDDPQVFTPMHPSAQRELKLKYNIELLKIFDPQSEFYWKTHPDVKNIIVNYRVNQLIEVYKKIFKSISPIVKSKQGFQLIVTAMDELGYPELREHLGVDMKSILQLQKEYNFVLQIEDPENAWSTSPMRYIDMGKKYTVLVGDPSKVLLDLNILYFRKKENITPFPTTIQTGTESFQLIRAAALGSDRFTIYSESSVNPQDLSFFANASAPNVQLQSTQSGFESKSPYHYFLHMPKEVTQLTIDGNPTTSFRNNSFLIPAGNHSLSISNEGSGSFSTSQLNTKILSFTGIIHSIRYGMREINFTYESDMRTLISLSAIPTNVKVDGNSYDFTVMKGNDCYSIFLPPGKHEVDLIAGDQFAFGINVTSLWSTTAIAIFGTIAIGMLFLMYISLKIIKRSITKSSK